MNSKDPKNFHKSQSYQFYYIQFNRNPDLVTTLNLNVDSSKTSAIIIKAKVMKNLEELMEVSPEIPLIQDPKRHSCLQKT